MPFIDLIVDLTEQRKESVNLELVEINQTENKNQKVQRKEYPGIVHNIKSYNTWVIRSSESEERENCAGKKKFWWDNGQEYSKITIKLHIQVQEDQRRKKLKPQYDSTHTY